MSKVAALVKSKLGMDMKDFERHLKLASCEVTAKVRGQFEREARELELINEVRHFMADGGYDVETMAEMVPCGVDTLYKFLRRERSVSEQMYTRIKNAVKIYEAEAKLKD